MKDLSGLTHSFKEWSALLDFLAGLTQSKVTDIHIVRKGDKEWTMRVKEIERIANRKSSHPGTSLYDLYW